MNTFPTVLRAYNLHQKNAYLDCFEDWHGKKSYPLLHTSSMLPTPKNKKSHRNQHVTDHKFVFSDYFMSFE